MELQPKVLLVDDLEFFLHVEQDYLKQTPVTVLTARNGRQALEMARQERPDLIIMDAVMPEMNGLDCCRQLKGDTLLREIPVVMTYSPEKEMPEEQVLAAGCDACLAKPFDRKSFLATGHNYLFNIERREKRVGCQMTVDFTLSGGNAQGTGFNISPGGLYVRYRGEVPLGEMTEARFFLPIVSSQMVSAVGRFAWSNQGFPRPNLSLPQGFGIQFTEICGESALIIHRFLNRR